MFLFTTTWPWLLLAGAVGTSIGILLCRLFPTEWRKPPGFRFNVLAGLFMGGLAVFIAARFTRNPLISSFVGLAAGYLSSMIRVIKPEAAPLEDEPKPPDPLLKRILFRQDWDARPRYEKSQTGLFVGRTDLLDRLTSDFISKRSGTILISGVRGVGKTALVERALLEARNKLQNRYWKRIKKDLDNARFWQPVDTQIRQVLFELLPDSFAGVNEPNEYLKLKEAAEQYTKRSTRFFSRWFALTDLQIRRMYKASQSQLFVLKFNASDIGGAMAEPSQNGSGKPQINPEKLLRALIRKLYTTCHWSRPTPEAEILRWSLNKKERKDFFDLLESSYRKSISTSFKETYSDVRIEAVKRSQSRAVETKISVERILILAGCVSIGIYAGWMGWSHAWAPLEAAVAGGVPGAIAAYLAWTLTFKRSWESSSDRARQAQLSYESDYSLAQMENDLEKIVNAFHTDEGASFDRNRCFTRTVIVFDELDKLEDPVAQLNGVITHFKNFFTLSDALFVFITDHDFYEHLRLEGAKAQLERHYSPEHTFFTQKIYLRKPDFSHFREAVYGFCEPKGLQERVKSPELFDADLTDYLFQQKPEVLQPWDALGAETLAHLYISRQRYKKDEKLIEYAFRQGRAWTDPMALARVWASQVAVFGNDGPEVKETIKAFQQAKGWTNNRAVAFLYHRKPRFGSKDQLRIDQAYENLNYPPLKEYSSVDHVPFTLSDLARALCFQTRNHYFDLYYLIYDYVGSYADSAPVLDIEGERFTHEQRLWSRYQQLIDAAFSYRSEKHPSREYFNALLMESLFGVFDSRATRGSVKVRDILFNTAKAEVSPSQGRKPGQPKVAVTTPVTTGSYVLSVQSNGPGGIASTPATNSGALNQLGSLVTPRDTEKINEAIIRLLRLAENRKAITTGSELSSKLKSDDLKLEDIFDLTFSWNPDCEADITQEGIELEPYESELIEFWNTSKKELEAIDHELEKLWAYRAPPAESQGVKTRLAITELRNTVDGLKQRRKTISRPDATALRTSIGTAESWSSMLLEFFLERLADEDDSEILVSSNLKTGPADAAFKKVFDSSQRDVSMVSRLPLSVVVFPNESQSLIYLLSGPTAPELDEKPVRQYVKDTQLNLLWCVPEKASSQRRTYPETVRFFFLPPAQDSLVSLWLRYVLLAGAARLKEIVPISTSKSQTVVLRGGAELVGPLTGPSEAFAALTHPALRDTLALLEEMRSVLLKKDPGWRHYEIDERKNPKAPATIKKLAEFIASRSSKDPTPSFNLTQIVEAVLLQSIGENPSALSLDELTVRLTSVFLNDQVKLLLGEVLGAFMRARLTKMGFDESSFPQGQRQNFVTTFVQKIEEVATKNSVEPRQIPSSFGELVQDLEQYRLSLSLPGKAQKRS